MRPLPLLLGHSVQKTAAAILAIRGILRGEE